MNQMSSSDLWRAEAMDIDTPDCLPSSEDNTSLPEPMDIDGPGHPPLLDSISLPAPIDHYEANDPDGLYAEGEEVSEAAYATDFEPGGYLGTPVLSEMDHAQASFVNSPREDTITSLEGETIHIVRVGVPSRPLSDRVLFVPRWQGEYMLLRSCQHIARQDGRHVQKAAELSTNHPSTITHRAGAYKDFANDLLGGLVQDLRQVDKHYMAYSAYTGQPLSWAPGPLSVSVEAPYLLAKLQKGNARPWWGYHSEANAVLIEDCLNWAKGHWIPVVLPLIAAMLRVNVIEQGEKWQWLFNALTNASFLQYTTESSKGHTARLAQWLKMDERSLIGMIRATRMLDHKLLDDSQALNNFEGYSLLSLSRTRRNHWQQTKWRINGSNVPIAPPDVQELALHYLQLVAVYYGIPEKQFFSLFTIPDPRGKPVFCPFSPVCHFLLRKMGYRWEDLFIFCRCMLDRKKKKCNKYAEERGFGEPDLDVLGLLIVMMHDLGQKYKRACISNAQTAEAIILDSFKLPYVPFRGHPLCLALCKRHDHGIAMISGLTRYPSQEGFDPVKNFDWAFCTFAFESAFTNNICRNYHPEDLPEIRARTSLVPLEHQLWILREDCGKNVWRFEEDGPLATRPSALHGPAIKLASSESWTQTDLPSHERIDFGWETHRAAPYHFRQFALKGDYHDFTVPYSQNELEIAKTYWSSQKRIQSQSGILPQVRSNDLYTCTVCDIKLGSPQTLDFHLAIIHTKNSPFKCNYSNCNKAFTHDLPLQIHIRRDHLKQDGDVKCAECDKSFFYHAWLAAHKRTHGPKDYICRNDGCSARFSTQARLNEHVQGVHRPKDYICQNNGCLSRFTTQARLNQHVKGVHGPKDYICQNDGCSSRFRTQTKLNTHVKEVHGPKDYICQNDGCSSRFHAQTQLNTHVKKVHGPKDYICQNNGCSSRFRTQDQLNGHIKGVHGLKDYICQNNGCSSRFRTQSQLSGHIRAVHGLKNYICQYNSCSSRFTRQNQLKRHVQAVHKSKNNYV